MDSKKFFNKKDQKAKIKKEKREEKLVKEESVAESSSEAEESENQEEISKKQEEIKIEKDEIKIPKSKEDKVDDKYFSAISFKDLNLSEQTEQAVDGLGYKVCSEI